MDTSDENQGKRHSAGDATDEREAARDSADRDTSAVRSGLSDLPVLSFDDVSRGGTELLIDFRGQLYRLRVTQNGKLILNK